MSNIPFAPNTKPEYPGVLHLPFDSVSDLLDYVEGAPTHPVAAKFTTPDIEGSNQIKRGSSWKVAQERAIAGWPEALDRVKAFAEKLQIGNKRSVNKYHHRDDEGLYVDIDRYVEGDPDFWVARRKVFVNAPARVVDIVVNLTASWKVDPSYLERRGAAIAALVQALESRGTSAQVTVTFDSYERGVAGCRLEVVIKRAGEQLDLGRFVGAVIEPAFLRRFTFAASVIGLEKIERGLGERYADYGLGTPANTRADDGRILYIPAIVGSAPQWANDAAAEKWVQEQVSKFFNTPNQEEAVVL